MDRLGRSILAGVVVVVAAAAGALLVGDRFWGGYEPDCDDYAFNAGDWTDDGDDGREHQAEALVECGTLLGLRRSEVAGLLGQPAKPGDRNGSVRFSAGWANDGIGPGDAQHLHLTYDADRVVSAELTYPQ
jgi:hypothetical protein